MSGNLRRRLEGDGDREVGGPRLLTRRQLILTAGAGGAGLGAVGGGFGSGGGGSPSTNGGEGGATATADQDEPAPERDGTTPDDERSASGGPVIGANLNGRPHRLWNNLALIDASGTTWLRAFVDVRKKLDSGLDPEEDPDVIALRQAVRERDCRLVVSLKWDFTANWGDKEPMNVPQRGSNHERELRRCALRYLRRIEPAVVVLGNEPMWETQREDIGVEEPAIVRFTRGVKDYLVQEGGLGDPSYLVGSLNRIHDDTVRERWFPHFYRELIDLVREDDDVDGIDLHLHYDELTEAEEMIAVVREDVPEATIAATEFSPVWRYERHLDAPIQSFDAGGTFARDYDLPDGMSVVEYFEAAKRNPRPPREIADFYDAMPWYNVNHVADVFDVFDEHDVSIGTFGLLQGRGMRNEDWTTGWVPFHINFLFQPALMRAGNGIEDTAHPHYIGDYRERAAGPRRIA